MCYSFAVPSNGLLSELPINFQNDGLSWDQLRLDQEWEKSSSKEEIKHVLGLRGQPRSSQFRVVEPGQRAYPRYFAPGIVCDEGKNWLRPLRYSIRPSNSAWDLSTKYSLYNARLDRLLEAKTWRPLIGHRHGILPFTSFFEWVERKGKKTQIQFIPEGRSLMWAPILWDYWTSPGKEVGHFSCTLITDDPAPEVEAAGHDRSPIFLDADYMEAWLDAESGSAEGWQEFLKGHRETVAYRHSLAA
ncbi:SOS response-associated peptidase [Microbulbifer variabilis]|uniref:Abasic site processing protein n=1 Tax=Microbulbifer variabilis TaxID=266805 RepID=A0ABY4V690_9GAMM|nr:SOS response-associated peptidase family protein [Microbulbifer variabilis]USD19795.1 SOS response-associated peptidase [Microbulbifer variabilis]